MSRKPCSIWLRVRHHLFINAACTCVFADGLKANLMPVRISKGSFSFLILVEGTKLNGVLRRWISGRSFLSTKPSLFLVQGTMTEISSVAPQNWRHRSYRPCGGVSQGCFRAPKSARQLSDKGLRIIPAVSSAQWPAWERRPA